MATRIVAAWYQLNQDIGFPPVGLQANYSKPGYKVVDGRDPASKPILLQSATEGHVLVKNVNNALPLRKPRIISLFGYDAVAPRRVNLVDVNANYGFGFLSNLNFFWYSAFVYPFKQPGQISPNGTLVSSDIDTTISNLLIAIRSWEVEVEEPLHRTFLPRTTL